MCRKVLRSSKLTYRLLHFYFHAAPSVGAPRLRATLTRDTCLAAAAVWPGPSTYYLLFRRPKEVNDRPALSLLLRLYALTVTAAAAATAVFATFTTDFYRHCSVSPILCFLYIDIIVYIVASDRVSFFLITRNCVVQHHNLTPAWAASCSSCDPQPAHHLIRSCSVPNGDSEIIK